MQIQAHGITAALPSGWEAEIMVRPESEEAGAARSGEPTVNPVAHLASFPLPGERGDFGSGAVEVMDADDLLVCLVEYDSASASSALFSSEGIPLLNANQFSPESMQRALPGQSGAQMFFNTGGRAFCLYVVLGSHARRRSTVEVVNRVLAGIKIAPA